MTTTSTNWPLSADTKDELCDLLNALVAAHSAKPTDVTPQKIRDLKDHFAALADAPQPVYGALSVPSASEFCTIYKSARPILEILITMLPWMVPGVGSTASAAIAAFVGLGDKACS